MDTPLRIEKDAAEVFTRTIFYDVQKEIKASCFDLKIDSLTYFDDLKIFIVQEKLGKKKVYEVKHNKLDNTVDCSCKKFIRIGIPCRHIFLAFNHGEVLKLPRPCIAARWMKNIEQLLPTTNSFYAFQYSNVTSNTNTDLSDIWFEFQSCVGLVGLDKEKLHLMKHHLTELKHRLRDDNPDCPVIKKNDLIKALVGSHPVEDIEIQLPHESRNKGCGKRIMTGAEKSISDQKKRMRTCKSCGQQCNHDSRNCPNK